MKRFLMAVVEYDGTQYLGFQIQRSGPTIQGELERALTQVTGSETRVTGAGRTDAGVHAQGQVIHFTAVWAHRVEDLQRALNAVLPKDIAVTELSVAPEGFHARYSARSRVYRYTIYNGAVRSPLAWRYAYHCSRPLDADAMDSACRQLIGRHDFLAFGWPPSGENTVRTVHRASCQRVGKWIYVDIEADAFLRKMARRVVANLLLVGKHELSVGDFAGLLLLGHRRTPAADVPAQGLCLVKVNY